MAKVTNFLSIALLVSVFAVSPVFAAGFDAADPKLETVDFALKNEPASLGGGAATSTCTSICTTAANGTHKVLNVVDYANPFAYRVATTQASYPATARLLKYLTVMALVVTNPTVQSTFDSLVSTVQGICGMAEDDSDEDTTEPTRLVIGRKA